MQDAPVDLQEEISQLRQTIKQKVRCQFSERFLRKMSARLILIVGRRISYVPTSESNSSCC
jgi:hypothetical protein